MEKLKNIINSRKLTPNIINKDSNFVVITYWWGKGNINRNTQKPCPDEVIEGEELEVHPIKYDEMINHWINSCKKMNCNYLVEEFPEFAVRGGYQMAINAKPLFINRALDFCEGRAVVYIDGDMTVNNYPDLFDIKNIDYMARGWNIDPRANKHYLSKTKPICFDPFTFETSGGIMYFADTDNARKLLSYWSRTTSLKGFEGKADDRIVSLLVNIKKLYLSMNILQLPIEYLWLTDFYEPYKKEDIYLNKVHYDRNLLMFEHPACLTSEEKAAEEGAALIRNPKFYNPLVEDYLDCQTEGGIFFEYIIFDEEKQLNAWKKYLKYMSIARLYVDDEGSVIHPYYIVPYRQVYGKNRNNIAENNIKVAKELQLELQKLINEYNIKDTVIVTEDLDIEYIYYKQGIIYTHKLIPTVLSLMYHFNRSVIYIPSLKTVDEKIEKSLKVSEIKSLSKDFKIKSNEKGSIFRKSDSSRVLSLPKDFKVKSQKNIRSLPKSQKNIKSLPKSLSIKRRELLSSERKRMSSNNRSLSFKKRKALSI